MVDPIFWLGLSILLVAVSLAAVLVAALPALQELARAARSAEKLFDTLHRELPPTLESIRLTSLEITELTDDMSQGVQGAGRVVQQVDQSLTGVKKQAKQAQITTRSTFVGLKAAWNAFSKSPRRSPDRLSGSSRPALDFEQYSQDEPSRSSRSRSDDEDTEWQDAAADRPARSHRLPVSPEPVSPEIFPAGSHVQPDELPAPLPDQQPDPASGEMRHINDLPSQPPVREPLR